MNVVDRIALIRNKLQPLRVLVAEILAGPEDQAAMLLNGTQLVLDSERALDEIIEQCAEIAQDSPRRAAVWSAFRALRAEIAHTTKPSRELSCVLTKLDEAEMWLARTEQEP